MSSVSASSESSDEAKSSASHSPNSGSERPVVPDERVHLGLDEAPRGAINEVLEEGPERFSHPGRRIPAGASQAPVAGIW